VASGIQVKKAGFQVNQPPGKFSSCWTDKKIFKFKAEKICGSILKKKGSSLNKGWP
jgi:hypothetical protein